MDITGLLEILGIERLDCVQLEDLASKIDHAVPDKINGPQVLMVLLGWLHEQIKRDNLLQYNTLFLDFVSLLHTGGNRQVCRYSKEETMSAFQEWQSFDAVENPTNRRRYLMAKSELEQLFDESTSDPVTSRELRSHRESAAYIQPTAIRSPQKPLGNISNKKQEDAFGKKQQIGANDHPLGQRHTHSNSKGGTGGVDNEDCRYNQPYTTPKKNASSSLLLGDTYAPLDPGTDELTIVQEAALQRSAERMPRAESSKGAYGGHSLPPPPNSNYICKRCNKRGHWIQFCPTNLDPSWDKPPAPSYRCEICGQTGKHFGTLCPFNKKESSLTQQRERASIKTKSPIRDEGRRYRDRRSPRQRSMTPTRASRYTGYDIYRPGSSPQALYEGSRRRPRPRSPRYESPPRARKARKTRDRRENSPIRQTTDHYDPRDHKAASLRIGDNHADTSAARGLDRIVRSDEGRLSYDDELYIDAQSPPPAPKTKKTTKAKKTKKAPKSKPDDQLLKEGNVLEHEGPEPVLNTEEVEQSKQDTDQFLRELEAEILAARSSEGNSPIHVPFEAAMLQGTREDLDNNVGIDETNMDETNSPQSDDTCTVKDDSTSFEAPDGNRYRLVTETHFRPEIRALFNSRANPIINNRSNRKAASQMWTFF